MQYSRGGEGVNKMAGNKKCIPGLVSVVIPTYNQKDFVRETFDSALSQDYQNIEIIITDNGSSDGTVDVINEYVAQHPGKIVSILSERNTGLASNFNRGLAKARGEYVAWLDGDDVMFPERIGKQVNLLRSRPDAVGCCHDAEVFRSPSGEVLGVFSELCNGKRGVKEGGVELWFDAGYLMLPTTFMYRTANIPEHGFDERLKYANDLLFHIEVFRQGKCAVIDEVMGRYRRHANNATSSQLMRDTGIEEAMIVLGIVEARYPELINLTRKRRIGIFFAAATKLFKSGDAKNVRYYVNSAIHQGAWLRGPAFYVAFLIFGSYISKQSEKIQFERSYLFKKLSKYFKGSA